MSLSKSQNLMWLNSIFTLLQLYNCLKTVLYFQTQYQNAISISQTNINKTVFLWYKSCLYVETGSWSYALKHKVAISIIQLIYTIQLSRDTQQTELCDVGCRAGLLARNDTDRIIVTADLQYSSSNGFLMSVCGDGNHGKVTRRSEYGIYNNQVPAIYTP